MEGEEEDLDEKMIIKCNNYNKLNTKKKIGIIIIVSLIIIFIILISILIIKLSLSKDENEAPTQKNQNLYFEPSSGVHTHTIIFMPGLTNTPEDFVNVLTKKISISKRNTTKVVLLRTPLQNVTALNGTKNYSWFDIYSFLWVQEMIIISPK